jgi:hypothetical protein
MVLRRTFTIFFILLALSAAGLLAQEPSASPSPTTDAPALKRHLGDVKAIDPATGRLTLQTDAGESIVVTTDSRTSALRAEPGARDLSGATPLTLAEIAQGDRVLARGTAHPDGTLSARQIVVMTRSALTQKQDKERAEWRARGLSGVITALDPAKQEITAETRTLLASQTVTISTTDPKAVFRRYAPDSVKFDDARQSSFAELQVGDQIRALGHRTPDSRMTAEQVVSGSFQILSGALTSVNADGREIKIVDNETRKPLTVVVGPETMVRRIPPAMAQRLAARSRGTDATAGPGAAGGSEGGGPGMRRRFPGAGDGAAGAAGEGPARGGPGERRGGGGTLQDLLERLPALPLTELKPGDQVALSSTRGSDPSRVAAVVLLAGIEPLLEARPRGAAGGEVTPGLPPGSLDLGFGAQ